jgi:hypothetical protein
MLAHGRLGQVQHRGGAVKSTTVGDRDDTAQRGDIQYLTHATTGTPISIFDQFACSSPVVAVRPISKCNR